ncbi:choice-of-anchor Q domain-containing protein [Spirosoma telluris]
MNILYSSQPIGSFQSSQIRALFRRVSLLVWLFCLATTVNGQMYGQLYYVLNDGSASTQNDQLKKRAGDGSNDSFIIDNFADSPGSIAIDGTNKKAFIVENRVTTSSRIYAINLTAATSTTFLASTSIVTGVAVDNINNYLYYTASDGVGTTQNDYLRRIGLNGTGDVAVGSAFAYSAGNIALDLANNRAFVADRRFGSSQIYAIDLSTGATSTFLIPTPPASTTVTVRGMAVDATNNYLYYAVSDNDATRTDDALWRINLDGTGNTQLSTGNVYSMGDIALDKTNNRVYMSDLLATAPRIAYINLNTNQTFTFYTPSSALQITGLSFEPPACPTSFIVNNLGDGTDANPGDGVCATSGGVCTLRAAMQEANALTSCPGSLSISFNVTGTINTSSMLPTIARDLVITGPGASQLTVNASGSPHQLFYGIGAITIANLSITNGSGGSGAAIAVDNGSSLTVTGCALINNTTEFGGQIYATQSSVRIQNSAITSNTATSGRGVNIDSGSLTIVNSTIAGNERGIYTFGSLPISLLNVTMANNSYGIMSQSGAPTITVKNSILANVSPAFITLGGSTQTITSLGNNLCTDASLTPTASGDLINTNPLLAPLGYYGGSTPTRALLPGSPAINAGTGTGAPISDQRGVARSGNTDIGAFESRVSVWSLPAAITSRQLLLMLLRIRWSLRSLVPIVNPWLGHSHLHRTGIGCQH